MRGASWVCVVGQLPAECRQLEPFFLFFFAREFYRASFVCACFRFKELEDAKAEVDAECARLKNDTAAGRTERELDELKAKLADSAREKEELAAEVASVQESFLKLGQEMVQMQMDQAKQLDAAREDERAAAKGVYDTLEACQFDLETERSRASELEQRNLQLETDLREADEWRVKYEQRWGLSEAVAYQNQLKNQLQIRDDQIAKLNFDISAAQSNIQKMDVALRILRRECGKPDDWMPAGEILHCCRRGCAGALGASAHARIPLAEGRRDIACRNNAGRRWAAFLTRKVEAQNVRT